MKIAIIGTRGIPNRYGGFEQLAEYLSVGLVEKGHEVYVYNSHSHLYQEKTWRNVHLVHCYDPEDRLGSAGQFIYDLNCIIDSRKRNFDVILVLGYTSSSVWGGLFPKKSIIIYNMDGIEWKRSKYSASVKKFLFYAEQLAIRYSDYVIADSTAIQTYLEKKYKIPTRYIAYGAEVHDTVNEEVLKSFDLEKYNYFMFIGRMISENNIEMILDGFTSSNSNKKFLVISNPNNKYGNHLMNKYRDDPRIMFPGTIFDAKKTHTLKFYSYLYFHGHSVGGTNPALVEAMASQALIAANDNEYNRAVLQEDGYYFSDSAGVKDLIENTKRELPEMEMVKNNFKKIKEYFNWENIIGEYENYMVECFNKQRQ